MGNFLKTLFKTKDREKEKPPGKAPELRSTESIFSPKVHITGARPQYCTPAIEVGTNSLKLLQVAVTSAGYEITKCAYVPLSFRPGQSQYYGEIKSLLHRLIEENKISGEVVTSLPMDKIQTLTYILPTMPASEVEQAVAWKLKQNPPSGIAFANLSFDYVPCTFSKDEVNQNMLVFVAYRDAVMERFRLFKEISLDLIAVEPKPYAALRALLWFNKISKEETVLVLQLGAGQSSIIVAHAGQPYLIRPLAVSGNTFTEAIANYHRFDWQKAEEIKKKEGLKGFNPFLKDNQALKDSYCWIPLSSQLENLIIDVEHAFGYFSRQLMKSQVTAFSRIVLCGGSSRLDNLAVFLADRLAVPVDIFNPLTAVNPGLKQKLGPKVEENSASFASILGMAVRCAE
jgi:type IV pilus assembly protein PilM